MVIQEIAQVVLYFVVLLLFVKPLGWYMAQVYEGRFSDIRILGGFEKLIYQVCGIQADVEMDWKSYLRTVIFFNLVGLLFVYVLQRFQYFLPFNPQAFSSVDPIVAFNTAASFITNTDWESYIGESSLSYLTQAAGLTVQNFLSAATGIALLMALIRGIVRHETTKLGNFWVDIVRGVLYILLPLCLVFSLFLVSQGVIQNFKPYEKANIIEVESYFQPELDKTGKVIREENGAPKVKTVEQATQTIPMGPVASQEAIKLLGTNGGGYFATNSAHPFENPNPMTNFFEMLAILLIPAALCYSFGVLVKDRRQGWAILMAMLCVIIPFIIAEIAIEQRGNPMLAELGIGQYIHNHLVAANMEGKETRFGIVGSALWTVLTTATSNGSVNSMLDSYTPLGGLIPLWMMHLNEVIFGGVGSGLYGMLMLVLVTVFVIGLMVGRTPEYLGKKIEPFEIKMAAIAVLLMPMLVLFITGFASVLSLVSKYTGNPGPHGFTEILYAITSMGNNNGSAFSGLDTNTLFFNVVGGLEMLASRFWIAIATLAIAGSLVRKKIVPISSGTLLTHTPLFITLLVTVILILGVLTFLPALMLGPIAEYFKLWSPYVN